MPDLDLAIMITSDALSEPPLYRAKGIRGVWTWRDGRLRMLALGRDGYADTPASRLLPGLESEIIDRCRAIPNQYDAVQAFRQLIAS